MARWQEVKRHIEQQIEQSIERRFKVELMSFTQKNQALKAHNLKRRQP